MAMILPQKDSPVERISRRANQWIASKTTQANTKSIAWQLEDKPSDKIHIGHPERSRSPYSRWFPSGASANSREDENVSCARTDLRV
jgi:hypothetical protein